MTDAPLTKEQIEEIARTARQVAGGTAVSGFDENAFRGPKWYREQRGTRSAALSERAKETP